MLTYFDDVNVQNEEKIFDMSVDKADLPPKTFIIYDSEWQTT